MLSDLHQEEEFLCDPKGPKELSQVQVFVVLAVFFCNLGPTSRARRGTANWFQRVFGRKGCDLVDV